MPILNDTSSNGATAAEPPPIPRRHMTNPELEDITRRGIPPGAEAATVMVGQLHGLEKPVISLVRLAESVQMPGLTEVPINVRFLFVLLGPIGGKIDYNELGRCFGTLMSSEVRRILSKLILNKI